jgi:hypothetical protein
MSRKLTLYQDPLLSWGIDRATLISEFLELVTTSKLTFLGWKTNLSKFEEDHEDINYSSGFKYINLFSLVEGSEQHQCINLQEQIIDKISNTPYTNNVLFTQCTTPQLTQLRLKLASLFDTELNDIRIMFIQSNTVLLPHRDDEYYKKNKQSLDGTNYVRLTDSVLTSVALNWSLTGSESTFKIKHDGREYTNEVDKTAVMFFDPCAHRHSTTLSVPRITLSVRVANLEHTKAANILDSKLETVAKYD